MNPERWQKIQSIFESALERDPALRSAYLDQACAGDDELRREVESLLAAHQRAGGFLEAPPLELAAELMAKDESKLAEGEMIGPYEILTLLGEGGMGEVYLAHDTKLQRTVALKILPAHTARDRNRARRFIQEARAAAALSQPNISVIYEVGETPDGRPFIVMEHIQGQALSNKIKGGPLDPTEIIDVGMQVADALDEAHSKGVVHRDIKPSNIMVTARGQVKVLDFGIAKVMRPEKEPGESETTTLAKTEPGMVVGTVDYMSPEQALGKAVDHRTDIFSLGVLMYEMATGRRPFSGASATETIDRIIHAQPDAIARFNYNVPAELERIINKSLAKDRAERYQSAKELSIDLKRLKKTLEAAHQAAVEEKRPKGSRRKAIRAALPLLLAVVLAVAVVNIWLDRQTTAFSFAARDWVLVSDFQNLTGESLFDKSLTTALAVSLAQSPYANLFPRSRIDAALERMRKSGVERIDEKLGREICIREGVKGLISCEISKIGQGYVLAARLIEPQSGNAIRSYVERARDQDHVLPALESIATRVRRDLGESLSSIERSNRPLPNVTTSSLQALKHYVDGAFLWNRGQWDQAMHLYQSALGRDPDFAMAHSALARAYYSYIYNNPVKGNEHYQKALKLSDRLTERERLYIQASYNHDRGYYHQAIQLYNLYLKTYPDDTAARFNLGKLLMEIQRHNEAIEQHRQVLRIIPNHAGAYINIATSYNSMGNYAEALKYYAKGFELEPSWLTNNNVLNHEYGFALVGSGDPAKAREVFSLALATPEIKPMGLRSLALLDLYQGRYREAKERLREAILLNESAKALLNKCRNHLFMSIVLEGEGDRAGCLGELDRAAECLEAIGPQVLLSARIGKAYVRCGAVKKAARILDALKKQADQYNQDQSSSLHWLEGEIELARGNARRAIELLMLADRESRSPLTVESLAHAYATSGNIEQAIACYETLVAMRSSCLGWEPQQPWIAAHYRLAKAYLSRGEKEKAKKLTATLLGLWKEADAELPLLREALRLRKELENRLQ